MIPVALRPTSDRERIELLDVLRGFALFGILAVNVLAFASPIDWILRPPWTGTVDRVILFAIQFFAVSKFYSLFAFLFGVGFAIQVRRAERAGTPVVRLLARRYVSLFAIGALHVAFLWYGDILHHYALLGLLLLLMFRESSDRELLRFAGIAILVPIAAVVLSLGFESIAPSAAGRANESMSGASVHSTIEAYSAGSFDEVARQRWNDYRDLERGAIEYLPHIFGLFLLGVWCGRRRVLENIAEHRRALGRVLVAGLVLGVPLNLALAVSSFLQNPDRLTPAMAVNAIGRVAGGTVFCAAYVAMFSLAWQKDRWRRGLRWLAPAGKMALTNYLAQSVLGTAVFYSWGLGLYGRTGPAFQLTVAVVIFSAQIVASAVWLRRFRYGPVEWLWRKVTYGGPLPMRAR